MTANAGLRPHEIALVGITYGILRSLTFGGDFPAWAAGRLADWLERRLTRRESHEPRHRSRNRRRA